MASIKSYLDNIKNAVFGKDVRGSIHDGIDEINKEVESTTNRQVNLDATFKQLIINSGESNAEIVAARHDNSNGQTYDTLPARLDATTAELATLEQFSPLEGIESLIGLKRLEIWAGQDSLTANKNSYLNKLEEILRSHLGDGGAGLQMLDYQKASENGASLGKSANVQYMKEQAYTESPKKYSICGLGLYTIGGVNQTIDYDCKRKFTNARVIYLQQPGGGTFKVGSSKVSGTTYPTFNTDGVLDLAYIDVDASQFTGSGLSFVLNGNVALFGILYTNGASGVTVSRLAIGGSKLSEHVSLDSDFRKKWFALCKPNLYILKVGMNDRNESPPEIFESNVISYTNDIKLGNETAQILLLASNESDDYANSYLKDYELIFKKISLEKKYGFLSIRELFGTYQTAFDRGLMQDGVHPSDRGGIMEGIYTAKKLGFTLSKPIDIQTFASATEELPYIYKTELTPKHIEIPADSTNIIYKIGLTNQYPVGTLYLNILGIRQGTSFTTRKEIEVSIKNGTILNQVNGIGMVQETTKYTNDTYNYAVTIQIVNNSLQVSITSPSYYGDFFIEGRVKLPYLRTRGKVVYEN